MGWPVAPYGAPQASPSSGLLGTGLDVVGGVAAGMLVDEMLHRHQDGAMDHRSGLQNGLVDAPQQDSTAHELETRNVDFGTVGDWDSSDGDSVDAGAGGFDPGGRD